MAFYFFKNTRILSWSTFFIAIIVIPVISSLVSCSQEEAHIIEIGNLEFYDIEEYLLKAKSNIRVDYPDEVVDFGILYSKNQSGRIGTADTISHMKRSFHALKTSSNPIYFTIKGLEKATSYYVNVYIIKKSGEIIYGNEISIETHSGNRFFEIQTPFLDQLSYTCSGVINNGNYYYMSHEMQLYQYDLKARIWSTLNSLSGNLFKQLFVSIDSKLYVIGVNGQETWEYSISSDQWVKKANFPLHGEAYIQGFVSDGKIYAGVGSYYGENFWSYDPLDETNGKDKNGQPLGKWHVRAKMPAPMQDYTSNSFTIGDKGYLWVNNKDIYNYDVEKNAWLHITTFPVYTDQHSLIFSIGGEVYASSGHTEYFPVQMWHYNFSNDEWSQIYPDNLSLATKGGARASNDLYGISLAKTGLVVFNP